MAKCKCGVEMLDGEACKITKVALSNGKTFKRTAIWNSVQFVMVNCCHAVAR